MCGPCWNSWTPCTKAICGKMCNDISKFTWQAAMPWNFTMVVPFLQWFKFLASGMKWEPEINDQLNVAYGVHCIFLLINFIQTPIFRTRMGDAALTVAPKTALNSGDISVFDLMTIFTYAHTWCFLSTMWGYSVTRYPGFCCLKTLSAARFFAVWMLVAILFDTVSLYYHIELAELGAYYYSVVTVTCLDMTILIPIFTWSVAAAIETQKSGSTGPAPGNAHNIKVADIA